MHSVIYQLLRVSAPAPRGWHGVYILDDVSITNCSSQEYCRNVLGVAPLKHIEDIRCRSVHS